MLLTALLRVPPSNADKPKAPPPSLPGAAPAAAVDVTAAFAAAVAAAVGLRQSPPLKL
jgi:hypothetical protein